MSTSQYSIDDVKEYEASLTDREKVGYLIAQDHFRETNSFDLFKSNGFLSFMREKKEQQLLLPK
jgi:hypothetical protein